MHVGALCGSVLKKTKDWQGRQTRQGSQSRSIFADAASAVGPSRTDSQTIRELRRLGGLLKLWLTDDPRTARFGDATILALLCRIEATQEEMSRLMKSVVQPRAKS